MTSQTLPSVQAGSYTLDPSTTEIVIAARGAFGLPVQAAVDVAAATADVGLEPTGSQVQLVVDMASFRSGNARRDKDIRHRFFRVADHPTLTFTGTELHPAEDGSWLLAGQLTYRATCDVTVTLSSVEVDGDGLRAQGTARVDRYACGVTKGRGIVGRWVEITFMLRLRPVGITER
jgi:polyisoprenoid-binding protein YceI